MKSIHYDPVALFPYRALSTWNFSYFRVSLKDDMIDVEFVMVLFSLDRALFSLFYSYRTTIFQVLFIAPLFLSPLRSIRDTYLSEIWLRSDFE
jgi:hypothetical protein